MDQASILVLDDDEDITLLARSVLMMHKYNVIESNDPIQAIDIVKNQSFQLILVDIMMPQMEGTEFIRQAKKTETNANARYAILTAKRLNEEDRREIFDLGAEIMTKPFIPINLVEKITELLR